MLTMKTGNSTKIRIYLNPNRKRHPGKKTTLECTPNKLWYIFNTSYTKETIVKGYDGKIIEPTIGENYIEYNF